MKKKRAWGGGWEMELRDGEGGRISQGKSKGQRG